MEAKLRLLRRLQKAAQPTLVLADVTSHADLAPQSRYKFRGANLEIQRDRSPELVIAGGAGTGKTLANLWKLHTACATTPNVRCLIVRKTRASLTESALVTYEQYVLPPDCGISDGAGRTNRHSYRYPNGSEIVVGGLDKPGRIMSTEYDLIYICEAIELDEADWEACLTRCRGRALGYNQVLADTNPDRPTHWLRRRATSGAAKMLDSRHEDNPAMHDGHDWTEFGRRYLVTLDALTGPRRARLRDGRWVQAEGVVYDGWNPAIHVIDPFPIPRQWPRYWSLDWGFTNPLSLLIGAMDNDGRIYIYKEIYRTGRLVEDHARFVLRLCGVASAADWPASAAEPRPRLILCDHDREDRETFERHSGLGTTAAKKGIEAGIQSVAARLRVAGDGKPRVMIFRNCLVERDPVLEAARKPCCLIDEFDGYVWDLKNGKKKGEEPVDRDNHSLDALRYMLHWFDAQGSAGYQASKAPTTTWVDEGPPAGRW